MTEFEIAPPLVETVTLRPALVVDDDPAMQQRLVRVLGAAGCDRSQIELADDVASAQRCLAARRFGVVLVDIGLPDASGVELIGWMSARLPAVPAVVISAWRTEAVILAALRAGAIGYLLKERDDAELLAGLRSIEKGGAPIDPAIARRILALLTQTSAPAAAAVAVAVAAPAATAPLPRPRAPAAPGAATAVAPRRPGNTLTGPAYVAAALGAIQVTLSRRERSILELVAQGLSNREMAESLSISVLTVECHTKNIYRKLAVSSRTEAVFAARRHGLLH